MLETMDSFLNVMGKPNGLIHVFEWLLMMMFGRLTVEGLEQGNLWD